MTRASSSSSCDLLNREWASLPPDLVFEILDRLLEPADHGRFAAICKRSHFAAKNYNQANRHTRQLSKDLLPPPTLLIREVERRVSGNVEKTTLFSVSEGRIYNNVKLPVMRPSTRSCYACGHGWLSIVYEVTEDGVAIELQNPFRNPSTSIRLPFLKQQIIIGKVMLSADPALNPDSYVVGGGIGLGVLAFIRARQQHWTFIRLPTRLEFIDSIFSKSQMYALGKDGELLSVNLDSNSDNVLEAKLLTTRITTPLSFPRYGYIPPYKYRRYLVESTKGDILYVERLHDNGTLRIVGFKVYKVVFSDGDGSIIEQLLETRSIGDEALFLDDNHAISVSVSNFPKCQRNSIYCSSKRTFIGPDRSMRTFVFNLEDETITQPYPLQTMQIYAPPHGLWIMPSFNSF